MICPYYKNCQTDYLGEKKPNCIVEFEGRYVCRNTVTECAFVLQLNLLRDINEKVSDLEKKLD